MVNAKTAHRIAFVSDAIYPYNKGGKETRLHEISMRLAKRGYDVHIYCMKWWTTPEKVRIEEGVTLHAISPLYPLYSGERRSIKQGILFGLACLKLFKEEFDVIDVDHMPYFPLYSVRLACWLKGKKMFATWHEVWGKKYWLKYMGVLGFISSVIEYISFQLPNVFIASSFVTKERLLRYVDDKKIHTINNGVNYAQILTAPKPIQKSDVIFAGRLLKHKNVDILIKAISVLKKTTPSIRCLIIGDGPEKNNLNLLVESLDLQKNIIFLEFCSTKTELYSLLKGSKILVIPSSREGYGIVVIEALAVGLVVVTVDEPNNAAKTLITDKNDGIVTKLTPESIASAIGLYLSTKKNNLPVKSKKIKDWDQIVKEITEVYSL